MLDLATNTSLFMKHISPFFCLKEILAACYMYCSKQLRPNSRILLHIWSCLPLKAQGSWFRNKDYNFGQDLARFRNNLMSSLSHWFPATLSAAICQSDAPVLWHSAFFLHNFSMFTVHCTVNIIYVYNCTCIYNCIYTTKCTNSLTLKRLLA